MRKNAMRKNLTQSIRNSLGRYIAIVAIIALGASMFVGLLMTKSDMVATGQVFMDEQNMFDLRLMNSYAWTEASVESVKQIDGIGDAEGVIYLDVIARMGENADDSVYRFYSIPETVNQVALRVGRMPERPNECLADGFYWGEEAIGQTVTLSAANDADTMDSMASRTYTVVGYVATPLYLDMNRGTTTVGNGSIENYIYIPADGFDVDYYTEIHVTLPGEYDIYSDAYHDMLSNMADTLEPEIMKVAQDRFDKILADAEEAYAEGYAEYLDGLREFEEGKLEAEQELADAYQKLNDAERELRDNEKQLKDGEKQIAEGWQTLADQEKELEKGLKELEKEKEKIYAELEASQKELDKNAQTVADNLSQVEGALAQINSIDSALDEIKAGLRELASGELDVEEGIALIRTGLNTIESALKLMNDSLIEEGLTQEQVNKLLDLILTVRNYVDEYEDEAIAFEQAHAEEIATLQAGIKATTAMLEWLSSQMPESEGAGEVTELEAQYQYLQGTLDLLEAQLEELITLPEELQSVRAEIESSYEEIKDKAGQLLTMRETLNDALDQLLEAQAQIDQGYQKLNAGREEAEAGFADAEKQLADGKKQLKAAKKTLRDKERAITDGKAQIAEAWEELRDGWADYYDGKAEADAELADAAAKLADAEAELADARQEIDDMEDPELFILDRTTNVGYTSLDSASDIVQGVAKVFPAFFLLVAALVCITTMTRMIDEERTQIGTLKALGYSNNAIISKYLLYAGSGAVLGCGLGVLIGSAAFPAILWEAYKIMLYISDGIELRVNWLLCGIVVGAYTSVMLLVTWYCCRKALREEPAELIRPKAPEAGKKIFLEYLPFWHRISFLNKVTIRNIFRYRQRLAMMLVGIGGCTALLVTGFGLRDSIVNVVDYQFQDVTVYDMSVYFSEGKTREQQEAFIQEVGDSASVMFYHQSSIELDHNSQTKEVYLIAAGDGVENYMSFHTGETPLENPRVNEVLLSVGMADMLGISVGDRITMRNSDMQMLDLTVSGIYDNYVYNYAVIAPETIEEQWGEPAELQMAFVKLNEGQDAHQLSADISGMEGVMNVSVSEDLAFMVSNMMQALDLVVVVIVVCAGALAVIVLYNLTNININERIREIATIKVLGFRADETAMYVFKENLSLTGIGAVFGLGLGYLLLLFVMSQIKIDFVWFKTVVTVPSYFWALLLTVLSAVIVDCIFYFKLDKINMAEALKSVE